MWSELLRILCKTAWQGHQNDAPSVPHAASRSCLTRKSYKEEIVFWCEQDVVQSVEELKQESWGFRGVFFLFVLGST